LGLDRIFGLLDAFVGVPEALEFADFDDLAGVVGVVGADVGDGGGFGGDLGVGGGGDGLLPGGEDGVEFADGVGPVAGVEFVEGLGVVGGWGWGLFAFELGEGLGVPEEEVVGEHSYRMVGGCGVGGVGCGNPAGLFGAEADDGGVDGDEPLGLVMGGAELGEQDRLQGGGRPGKLGRLSEDEGGKKEGEEDWFDRHSVIALRG
jgi:hypothetical protein